MCSVGVYRGYSEIEKYLESLVVRLYCHSESEVLFGIFVAAINLSVMRQLGHHFDQGMIHLCGGTFKESPTAT